jgi:hypothetical protein
MTQGESLMPLQIVEITEIANTDTRHFLTYLNANLELNKNAPQADCKAVLQEAIQRYKTFHRKHIVADETLQQTIELLEMCLGCNRQDLKGFLKLTDVHS